MSETVKAILWPNGVGWDVGDDAEVWKLANGLGVRIFTEDCKIKHLFINDKTLDPVEAVERYKKEGQLEDCTF